MAERNGSSVVTAHADRFGTEPRTRRRHDRASAFAVVWCLTAIPVQVISPVAGYVMMAGIYGWVLLGNGSDVLRGSWPATFLLEDITSSRGVKAYFGVAWIVHSLVLAGLLLA